MPKAICIKCGARKFGAVSKCEQCGFVPRSGEDLLQSMAISDYYLDEAQLNEISLGIKDGGQLELTSDMKTMILKGIRYSGLFGMRHQEKAQKQTKKGLFSRLLGRK